MFATPAGVISLWFRGLFSILIIVGGFWLLTEWYDNLPERVEYVVVSDSHAEQSSDDKRTENLETAAPTGTRRLSSWERVVYWRPRFDKQTGRLAGGALLLIWSLCGRLIRLSWFFASESEEPPKYRNGAIRRIRRPDGTEIHVEIMGPANAVTVILTHGWSLSRQEWAYLQKDWGDQFRLVVWDLPGLGLSTLSKNRVFTLEEMARDLSAVIDQAGPGPVVLAGHSIGGMTILTFCRLFPHFLGTKVSKLILIHTTYVNPLQTMSMSGLYLALQKPLIEPLLYLQIWLSPLVWLMNLLSYWNGSVHSSAARSGFAGTEPRSQLDFIARFYPLDSPSVVARGGLAMLSYDATATLPTIKIPVLVIGGEQDPVTSIQASQRIATDISTARLSTLNPAKHYGLIEHHTEFARQTRHFCLE